jgi:hypothetical protein
MPMKKKACIVDINKNSGRNTKIHNKYAFRVNIHIFVLKYLVQIQMIQNQFKISEGGKWNSHQMPCAYSSRMVKNYPICPIRIEIIHEHSNMK